MAYEEVRDPVPPAGHAGTSSTSLFSSASSARDLVRRAEYGVAAALPRRLVDEVLAQALGVSTEALRTAFARVHGESIYRALLKLRVELVDLTLSSDPALSPRAVAQVCGFGYFGRFHQIYRRNTGRSPEAGSTRDVADGAALQRARAAVAVAVSRLFEGVEPVVVAPPEPLTTDATPACRP
jgi:AraC-like DNA-binding protein